MWIQTKSVYSSLSLFAELSSIPLVYLFVIIIIIINIIINNNNSSTTFGKRSNSMRRNPKSAVTKQGWLYKQASSGVKQWNKRWFVLTDRCLFYYKDEKEDTVLGSLPLLSFRIGRVEPLDNITRKFSFKAEHAGTRTYYFSTDSHVEQEHWIRAMNEAAEVNNKQRANSDTTADLNCIIVTNATDPQQHSLTQKHTEPDIELPTHTKVNGFDSLDPQPSCMLNCDQEEKKKNRRLEEGGDKGEGPGTDKALDLKHHPNGWKLSCCPAQHQKEQQDNVVLRRGFVPRTAPERVAQRKSSMAQLQQWVNQRRGMINPLVSLPHYYSGNRGVLSDYYSYPGGSQYVEDFPLYPPGVRPDSICSVSAVGGYDQHWTLEERHRSLRDGPHQPYGPPMPRDAWGAQYYGGMETSMRRLSIQPRSRSVPRSPSSSTGGPYSPVPPNFASPARSLSAHFDRFRGRMRDDVIYTDQSAYSLRRSLSSPKVCSYTLYIHLITTLLRLTQKLLGRLCEQNRILKDHQAAVHRLRMDKDSLEEVLVATHQEMELYHNQPLAMEKLQFKKETLQNQLINIRGELSQASSALTTTRMAFEALEDEANAIHGDLWEQLNAGGQTELVRRHIQKEFWRVQDVLEGLHKSNLSRGTDTAKHRVASGASGSFSTNSPASPLSSVSLTSPLSPFSPVPGSQASPTKQLGPEVRTGCTQAHLKICLVFAFGLNASCVHFVTVGIVPPRTKSPTDEHHRSYAPVSRHSGKISNGLYKERPKSAMFSAEMKSKMSIEEQNERIRRNQSNSVREKRRSLNLSGGQSPANYKVVRRRVTAHEIDIKDLEAAVRGQGQESPRQEIARLRRLQVGPDHNDLDISGQMVAPEKIVIPERYLDVEDNTPLSPAEQKEKQKKLERIKTLIAKSNLQNMVPVLDGPVESGAPISSQQQLQEQEKRIEISCALAAEASRRSRILSGEDAVHTATITTTL
uniref:Pleckstrin homology domain containing, family A member 6 n=1 Tax=Echeneis naucrates TaxID=173247 RepID=A0A665VCD9_ECHNA